MTGISCVYVVHWPENGVMKIGYSAVRRWSRFVFSGADVVKVYEFDSFSDAFAIEEWLHDSARTLLEPAFDTATEEARILLGNSGAGYLECWKATRDEVHQVITDGLARAHAQADAQASGQAMPRTDGRTNGLTQMGSHLPLTPLVP